MSIKRARYTGDETYLGRFGPVKSGDILNLTDQEWDSLQRANDKRFSEVKLGDKSKGDLIEIDPKTMTPLQMEAAEIHNQAEEERLKKLREECDPVKVVALDLMGATTTELITRLAGAGIKVEAGVSRRNLIEMLAEVEVKKQAKKPVPTENLPG